jgi:hypothetical protein
MEESNRYYLFNPDYFTKANLIKDKDKIKNEIEELCSDEYLFWLEKIPPIVIEFFSYEELIIMASSNGSIRCTEYLTKLFNKQIKSFNTYYSMLNEACKKNYTEYVRWILNDFIIEDKSEPISWIKYNFEILFSHIFYNNNIVLFKEFEKKYYFLDYINNNKILLLSKLCKRKNTIGLIKYFFSNNNFNNNQIIKEIFNKIMFYDYDVFKIIYEKIKIELDNNDKEKFLQNNFIILKIIMEFENEPVFNTKLAELLIHRLFRYNTCKNIITYKNKLFDRYNEYHDENFKKVFKYLYWKVKPSLEDKIILYNSVCFRNNFRFGQYVSEYLIDDGLVIESFKEPYYDYYMYKKRIRDRLEYNKYNRNNNYQKDSLFI